MAVVLGTWVGDLDWVREGVVSRGIATVLGGVLGLLRYSSMGVPS